jgi:hypothetical protein
MGASFWGGPALKSQDGLNIATSPAAFAVLQTRFARGGGQIRKSVLARRKIGVWPIK